MLKSAILVWVITCFFGCKNETHTVLPPTTPDKQVITSELIKIKRAILALDIHLVDTLTNTSNVNHALPDQSSLLAWAVETQDTALVQLLLDKGASVAMAGGNRFSPLILACRYGNTDIIALLLANGAQPNEHIDDGTSAFQLCAGSATPAILQAMVAKGAKYATTNIHGQNALMWAANFAKLDNMQYLLGLGIDINQQTEQGYSALFFAIKSQNLAAVKTLVYTGADLLAQAYDGTTASQLAVYANNYAFLTWYMKTASSLITEQQLQAVLTAFDREGYQLLHNAVKAEQPQLVSILLQLGANPHAESALSTLKWRYEANFKTQNYTPPQLTPLQIAQQQGLENIVLLLNAHSNS